jgi:hypothetical protein
LFTDFHFNFILLSPSLAFEINLLNEMKTLGTLLLFFLISSCGNDYRETISGNGNVVQKEIVTDSFSVIDVSDKIDAEIIMSDNPRVIVEADENLIPFIIIGVNGRVLSISSEKKIRLARSKKVIVYCNKLEEINASAASNVFIKKPIQIDNLKIRVVSAADLDLAGDFNSLDIGGSSASDITVKGTVKSLSVNLSSASDLNAFDLKAEKANVDVSSAAKAKIFVSKEAYLRSSSAGDIIYKGSPEIIDSKSSSAGDIKKTGF